MSKEYVVSVSTSDIRQAIAQVGSALYDLLEQALMTAEEEEESDFDRFARETLQTLARHPDELSADGNTQRLDPEFDDDGAAN